MFTGDAGADPASGTMGLMVMARALRALVALGVLLLLVPTPGRPDPRSEIDPRPEFHRSTSELIAAAREYRASLEKLLPFHVQGLARATEALEKRRELLPRGIVARREVQEAEQARESAEALLGATRAQIAEAETLIEEAMASDALRRMPASPPTTPREGETPGARFTYYSVAGAWSLAQAPRVERFFTARFGRALPVSAFGQTPLHDRLGFDHRDALDVAVHPDSPEGQALMAYLRSATISFIAFRGAVPGAATGAHIHIGRASQRFAHATAAHP
jgi:hypothetical protein